MFKPDQYIEMLRNFEARQDDWRISAWQLSVSEGETLNVGLRDKEIGGVYAPPATRRAIGGSIYIVWHDNTVSKSQIDSLFLRHFEARLKRLRQSSYNEKFVIDFPEDKAPTEVAVFDSDVCELLNKDSSPCFEVLSQFSGALTNARSSFDGQVGAGRKVLWVMNSKGLNRRVESTSHSFGASADSLFWVGYRSHKQLNLQSVTNRLEMLNEWLPRFYDKPEHQQFSGRQKVVLLPSATASFMSHFLLANLSGEALANNSSAWDYNAFDSEEAVFDSSVSIEFDPTVDWLARSYRMDGRGLMAETATYVEGGRLIRPIVSLKAAKQLSCMPSPVPSGSGLSISTSNKADLFRTISEIDDAVVIPSVLGMHTQDSARANYSLSVPSALVVKNGEIVGTRKASLVGNFFEDLRNPVTTLTSPLHDSAGLSFESTVNFVA